MNNQPYDGSIKEILRENAGTIVPLLLPGATLIDVLDIERLRSPMRADRVYRIQYKGKLHILHLEFQAGADDKIASRLLIYHSTLWREYEHPVISIIIYFFKTSIPEPPLREMSDDEEILTFHFQVLTLWTEDACKYIEKHIVSMYPLLPAMGNAETHILLKAIDEMVEYYQDNETELGQRLLWFRTFLGRTNTVTPEDKREVEERLDTFEQLLEQSEYVRKQRALGEAKGKAEGRAEGEAKGKAEGKAEGEVLALQAVLVDVVRIHYPSLVELAQNRVAQTNQAAVLRDLIRMITATPDEAIARFILTPSSSTP